MEMNLHHRFVEEVVNSDEVITGFEISDAASVLERFGLGSVGYFLVVARLVDVVDDGEG